MYTLQGLFLVTHPVKLSPWGFTAVLGAGLLGYYIFRATNNQKDIVRKANGKVNIWGKPATFIRAKYTTVDGQKYVDWSTHLLPLLTSQARELAAHVRLLGPRSSL